MPRPLGTEPFYPQAQLRFRSVKAKPQTGFSGLPQVPKTASHLTNRIQFSMQIPLRVTLYQPIRAFCSCSSTSHSFHLSFRGFQRICCGSTRAFGGEGVWSEWTSVCWFIAITSKQQHTLYWSKYTHTHTAKWILTPTPNAITRRHLNSQPWPQLEKVHGQEDSIFLASSGNLWHLPHGRLWIQTPGLQTAAVWPSGKSWNPQVLSSVLCSTKY